MDQRIAELVDHTAYQARYSRRGYESNFLIVRAADVTDYALKRAKSGPIGTIRVSITHFLDAVGDAIQLMNCLEQFVDRRADLIVLPDLSLDGFHFRLNSTGVAAYVFQSGRRVATLFAAVQLTVEPPPAKP